MSQRIQLDASRLTIDLSAVAANYRLLRERASGASTGAAVKGNGYGLGAVAVSTVLQGEGCNDFFVATVDEGIELRSALPAAQVWVLSGALPGTVDALIEHRLTPVLNSVAQIERWGDAATGDSLAAAIHIDTGMNRLGLDGSDVERLRAAPSLLDGIDIRLIMSHLACADDPDHELNERQLERFDLLRRELPASPASLANSGGIFLGGLYHHDLVRPGIALYGGSPQSRAGASPGQDNPMAPVVQLESPVIQVRRGRRGETVGYGASHRLAEDTTIVTVAVGYADGFLRAGGGRGVVALGTQRAPIIGRISMDLITVDVGAIAPRNVYEGAPVELLGPTCSVDEVAANAGTISYEILTDLGHRHHRVYRPG